MKTHFITAMFLISALFCGEMLAAPAKKEAKKSIKKAVVPRPEKVKVSSFGFNAEDATSCLKKAIASNAREVIIDNVGKDYIIGSPIGLYSNQTITLEKGVVIRAKKGAFHKGVMFRTEGGRNITIQGMGNNRIIMNKKDYRNPKLYKQSEHRHIFQLVSVSNVTIKNISLEDSGGDGIYFGGYVKRRPYCENILVENVTFSGHNRLGLAVISGKNVTIRNCRFLNAEGCPPQGGIDLEPNVPAEKMVNILVENCTFENNRGAALSIAPSKLKKSSENVSVTVKNCSFKNNGIDLYLHPYYNTTRPYAPVAGKVILENLKLSSCTQFHSPVETVLFELKNCVFDPPAKNGVYFDFTANRAGKIPVGNVRFINCKLNHSGNFDKQTIFNIRYQAESLFSSKFGGDLAIITSSGTKKFDFAPLIKKEQERFAKLYNYRPAPLNINKLVIPEKDGKRVKNNNLHFRGGEFLQYAEKGCKINISLKTRRIGYDSSIHYSLIAPSGKKLQTGDIIPGQKKIVSFTAEETGIYHLFTKSFNVVEIDSSHKGNGWTANKKGEFPLIQSSGRLYFTVPSGVKNFAVGVSGKSEISITGLTGERVLKNTPVDELKVLECTRKNADKAEVFYMEIKKMFWNLSLTLYAPLPPVVSTNAETLFR